MRFFGLTIFGVLLLFLFLFFGLVASKIGYKASMYFVSQLVVKNGMDKFRSLLYKGDGLYPEDRYRQYGVILNVQNNNIWMLTVDGIKHFMPVSEDPSEVYYLGLDSCKQEQGIKEIIDKLGSATLKETRFDNINSWLKNNSNLGLRFFSVTYLAEDNNSPIKRFRYIHALNGLAIEGDLDAVCLK